SNIIDVTFNPFADVENDVNYFTYVAWAFNKKIVNGTSTTTFGPNENVKRQQLAIMLWRMAGKPTVSIANTPFADVSVELLNSTAVKAIMWAYKKGIIAGKNGLFDPNGEVTREQMAIMLWRFAGKPSVSIPSNLPFADIADLGDTSKKAIIWCANKGISKGSNGLFAPADNCSRAQLCIFLQRFNKIKKLV
ncbi:MAG: S-layer homology domain-containing protein, partial [Erysipelotrichaceae bacterium]|nr:S-layer homology domain-containing protein [Erysipelotrichaceae bacterium]